mmetsp:Transcript_32987/g.79782  ORF Transcript_32987/g.79782 Transcript_32987/m.79782 type:complete len:225 (+) Transcript_32987:382-1056(+)
MYLLRSGKLLWCRSSLGIFFALRRFTNRVGVKSLGKRSENGSSSFESSMKRIALEDIHFAFKYSSSAYPRSSESSFDTDSTGMSSSSMSTLCSSFIYFWKTLNSAGLKGFEKPLGSAKAFSPSSSFPTTDCDSTLLPRTLSPALSSRIRLASCDSFVLPVPSSPSESTSQSFSRFSSKYSCSCTVSIFRSFRSLSPSSVSVSPVNFPVMESRLYFGGIDGPSFP